MDNNPHQIQFIKEKANNQDLLTGMVFKTVTAKSRLAGAPEYTKAEVTIDIDPETGASEIAIVPELIDAAQKLGVFTKKDGEPSYDGNAKYFQGEEVGSNAVEVRKRLIMDDDLYVAVYKACRATLDARWQAIRNNQGLRSKTLHDRSGAHPERFWRGKGA